MTKANLQTLSALFSRIQETNKSSKLDTWLRDNKYHDIVNEQMKEMYRAAFTGLSDKIKPSGILSIIIDETRDIAGHAQLALTLRWVSDDYVVSDDYLGFYDCSQTDAKSFETVKDVLLRMGLEISSLRGGASDGASVLQGGVGLLPDWRRKIPRYVHFTV